MSMHKTGAFFLLSLLIAACQQAESPQTVAAGTVCEDPRPEMCTREYRPVCALRDTERRTYGNACDACSDAAVISYTEGACEPEYAAGDGGTGVDTGQRPDVPDRAKE